MQVDPGATDDHDLTPAYGGLTGTRWLPNSLQSRPPGVLTAGAPITDDNDNGTTAPPSRPGSAVAHEIGIAALNRQIDHLLTNGGPSNSESADHQPE